MGVTLLPVLPERSLLAGGGGVAAAVQVDVESDDLAPFLGLPVFLAEVVVVLVEA
jgi:hypothetical protein